MEVDFGSVGVSFFSLEILSAISFLTVLIHFALIPMFEPIRRPQKNLTRAWPMLDFLLVCKVQFSALVLSVTHRTTGCVSLLSSWVAKTTRDVQQFTMTVNYSRQLMEMKDSSELSFRCRSVCLTTF